MAAVAGGKMEHVEAIKGPLLSSLTRLEVLDSVMRTVDWVTDVIYTLAIRREDCSCACVGRPLL